MLKKHLINIVDVKTSGYLKRDIQQAVDIILETISDSLAQGQRVEIRGFGSFSLRKHHARSIKNPATGKVMDIPPRNTVHFTMSKSLKMPLVEKKN